MKGSKVGSLYTLQGSTIVGSANVSTGTMSDSETKLWHSRLGHMGEHCMSELCEKGRFGSLKLGNLGFCEHCVYGKHKRVSFKPAIHNTKGILDYIHSNLWGPSKVLSIGGCNYLLTMTMIEKKTEKRVKTFRTDNGLEFVENEIYKVPFQEWHCIYHDTEEEVELDENSHHEDGPSPRRLREATPQAKKKSIAEERAKRPIKPPMVDSHEAKDGFFEQEQSPKGKIIIGCKWVYKKKEGTPESDGPIYKARVVAKGFTQIEGIDFPEVFSPVVKHSSIRVFLALVAIEDLELHQLDVKTTFLHGELEEEFEVVGKEDHVCRLMKSLYGLKQSPRQWLLSSDFDMKDLGEAKKILGMEIIRDKSAALSTTEAEFMAITEAFKEAKWLKGLVGEFSSYSSLGSVFGNSQSAIHLAKNQNTFYKRTKHIDVTYNFIRDVIAKKELLLKKIGIEENPRTC
uniref:Retrovirus-related Pol polyprotein from transposon TNT 1-94 n=1 Tax=Chenopodium quinoa TaxID=63459 RepID=A0A803N703_CHEQI